MDADVSLTLVAVIKRQNADIDFIDDYSHGGEDKTFAFICDHRLALVDAVVADYEAQNIPSAVYTELLLALHYAKYYRTGADIIIH